MHDPMTVAHEIRSPFKDKHGYKNSILTIWHNDPEKDGTDDSCGWFLRTRHLDKELYGKIKREFEFNFKHNYWFNEAGYPVFSAIGTAIEMYSKAAWIVFGNYKGRRKHNRFMKKHLFEIIRFAENPTDSLFNSIYMKFGVEKKEERISHFASIIYADIMRKLRPWWKHPKWHIHHWSLQFHPWQQFRRRYFDKCCICGKRGFTGSAYGDWDGTRIWCEKCNSLTQKPAPAGNK